MLKAFASKAPLNTLKSSLSLPGDCLFSGTADLNGSSDRVDSAGKEADLARLKWENGAPCREQTNVELFTAWLNRSFMNVQSR